MADLASLQRQRRFFILTSLAVLAYYAFDGSIGSADVQGLALTIKRPERVVYGLWFVWIWASMRYVQRIYELAHEVWREVLEDVEAEDQRIALRYAKAHAKRLAKQGQFNERGKSHVRIQGVHVLEPIRKVLNEHAGDEALYGLTEQGGRRYQRLQAALRWGTPDAPGFGTHSFVMEIGPTRARWLRFHAWVYAALALPAMSEHGAPMLLLLVVPFAPLLR